MKVHIIQHTQSLRYLTPYGWTESEEGAMRFQEREGAAAYMASFGSGGKVVEIEEKDEKIPAPIRRDYDPFGYAP